MSLNKMHLVFSIVFLIRINNYFNEQRVICIIKKYIINLIKKIKTSLQQSN